MAVVIPDGHIEAVSDLVLAMEFRDIGASAIDDVPRKPNTPRTIESPNDGVVIGEDFSADLDDEFIGMIAAISLNDEIELLQLLKLTGRRTPKTDLLISREEESDIVSGIPGYVRIDGDPKTIITANLERAGLVLNDATDIATLIDDILDDRLDLNGGGDFALFILKPMMEFAILAIVFLVEADSIVVAADIGMRDEAGFRVASDAEHIMDGVVSLVLLAAIGEVSVLDDGEALALANLLDEATQNPFGLAATLDDVLLETAIERHRLDGLGFDRLVFF